MAGSEHTEHEGLPSGTMLGKFEVLRKIATGGMAEIYLARVRGQAGFEKLVVVKRVLPIVASDPRLIQMFLDEARLVATFQHPNIADVHEVGEDLGAPFFAMEHVHGQDARSIRIAESERHQGVPLRVSLAIAHATASALDYAHNRSADGVNLNLVHRDVSPSNILVSYEGAIKLIDFGVARVTNQSHNTQAGTVRGKCPYMSPEQCRGDAFDCRSDLFSLGVVMYELTVGQRPFQGASDYEIMTKIVHEDPRRPSSVTPGYPLELEKLVMRLLARDVDRRFQTAEQLLHELEAFLDKTRLWVPLKKLSRYMQTLFADRLTAWEHAVRGDMATFAEHVALAMEPEHRRRGEDTPPTPLPVVMRLSQEIRAVAQDSEASLAQVYRPNDKNDPFNAIIGGDDEPVSFAPSADTVTTRTGESDIAAVLDVSVALVARDDTVTTRTGESELAAHLDNSVALAPSGDTVTTRTGEAEALLGQASDRARTVVPSGAGDTVTVRTGESPVVDSNEPSEDSITVRTGPREVLNMAKAGGAPVIRATTARPSPGAYSQHRPARPATASEAKRPVTPTDVTTGASPSRPASEPGRTRGAREPSQPSRPGSEPIRPATSKPSPIAPREEIDPEADLDSVAQALNAPSFMQAIDALGSSDVNDAHSRPDEVPIPRPPGPELAISQRAIPPYPTRRKWPIFAITIIALAILVVVLLLRGS